MGLAHSDQLQPETEGEVDTGTLRSRARASALVCAHGFAARRNGGSRPAACGAGPDMLLILMLMLMLSLHPHPPQQQQPS